MKLLTFAHRGEAQAFLNKFKFNSVDFFFDGLFKSDDLYLLITGEGPQIASEKTISVLTKFNDDIDEVYNIGVAGSLNPKCIRHELFWIRTAYAHHAERLEFKSFSSTNTMAKNDCITAFSRVLDLEEKTKLSLFADIVDRELWAVASATQMFRKPFLALKIISDDFESSEFDICQIIKEEAPLFSEKLLAEFLNKTKMNSISNRVATNNIFLDDPDFYFTTSQARKLTSLIQSLSLLKVDASKLNIQSIKELELLPKERTRILLVFLNDELNPMAKKIRSSLESALKSLNDASITTNFDNDFEQDWLGLTMKIQSSRDLEKIKNALKIFSYEDFKKVLNGDIDV